MSAIIQHDPQQWAGNGTPSGQDGADPERLFRLQSLTAALSEALTPEQAAGAVLHHGLAALGARAAVLVTFAEGGSEFASVRTAGGPPGLGDAWHGPLREAVRGRTPVVRKAAEGEAAMLLLPLLVRGRAVGGLALSLPTAPASPEQDLAFWVTLAGLCAQALERARLEDAERAARLRAERAGAERALLAAIVQSSEDAILSKTLDGAITSWNPAAQRLYGWSAEEARGQPVSLLIPPDRGDELPAIMARLTRGERIEPYETVRRRKDGARVDVSLSISPVRDEGGRITGASVIARDITGRKRLEEELRRRAAQLAEADARKDEFLALLAHELRTPLAPIRNAVHLLRPRGPEEPDRRGLRDMIDHQVEHLSRLVDDLLDVSRIARGKVRLRHDWVDLATVVSRAVEISRPLLEDRRHTLTVTLPPETLSLRGDATRLAQVLANLLNNAAKYTEPGGQVRLTAARQGDEAVVRVEDTGIGIPAEMLPKVFALFAQVERSLGHSQGGLGIGLTLVRTLVEMHGGVVEVSSDGPGRGSVFIVRLPLPPQEPARGNEEAPRPEAHAGNGRSCRVLVVDDSQDTAESVALLVRLWGHDVRVAHDGPGGLEAARAFRPQVVLLDIGVPGLSGLEVARQLREEPGFEQTVLVAVTGYGRDEDRRRSLAAGFDHHWVKPVDPAALQSLLASSVVPGQVAG